MVDTPYALGANVRPRDPGEDRYHLKLALPTAAVDLSQPRLLSRYKGADVRPPIEDQGPIGACAAYSAIACARICDVISGRESSAAMLSGDWLYEQSRKQENTFPTDAGSYLADNLDILMQRGAPLESQAAEQHSAAYDYGTQFDADAAGQTWIGAHHPFYPSEGRVLENIWTALDAGFPVQLGTSWPRPWFSPTRGIVDGAATAAQVVGGHAVYVWGICPDQGGHILCANQWTTGWATDAPSSGLPDMRPGDFAIPWSAVTSPTTLLFELRAVNPRPFTPQPKPAPEDADLALWRWLQLEAAYGLQVDQTTRRQQASVIQHALSEFYARLPV